MRRFFDYNFDRLDLSFEADVFGPVFTSSVAAFTLPDILSAAPADTPLFADIDGDSGDNTLDGTADADTINGFGGNDIINGFAGDDILNGGDGDDIISGGAGLDTIDGGAGFDLVSFADFTERVFVVLIVDTINDGETSATNVEGVIGTAFNDTLISDSSQIEAVYFDGGAGDDVFRGGNGDDTFIGGDGDDFVIARLGADTFDGGAGADRYSTFSLGLSFNPTQAYSADLALGQIIDNGFGDIITLIDVEGLSGGTLFADSFLGDANDNLILGNLGGADVVDGRAGDDTLSLVSGTGTIIGGTGTDLFYFWGSRFIPVSFDQEEIFQGVDINLMAGTLLDGFNEGGGSISGIENFNGSFYSDTLIGDASDNTIRGYEGRDFIDGGAGIDTISYAVTTAVTLDLGASTAIQDVVKIEVSTAASLDGAFLTDALNGDMNITITSNEFPGGDAYGVIRGVESDVIDGNGVRTVVFSAFGLDSLQDAGLNNVSNSGTTSEVRLTMISDAMGNLSYTVDMSVLGLGVADIAQVILNSANAPAIVDVVSDSGGLIFLGTETDTLQNFENILGSSFDDNLTGDSSDNEIEGAGGNDIINGGLGSDTIIYLGDQSQYTVFDNGDGTFTVIDTTGVEGTDIVSGVEFAQFADGTLDLLMIPSSINGTPGNDNLMGTSGDDVINGLEGNDILNGLAGDDIINGGDGADRLIGGLGADVLNGGAGFDSVDYRGAASGVRFNVDTGGTVGEALGDSYSGVERYYLSDFNDIITGSDANEFFFGEDGNDQINGGGGIDRIYGGEGNDIQRGQDGNDTLYGSAGNDQLNGGAGFDIANYSLAAAGVIVNMLTGGTGGDAAGDTYFGIEAVYGSDFDDSIFGNNSANELRGGDGNDNLEGGGGNDRLFGGAGEDMLFGGTGIDIAVYTEATSGVGVNLEGAGTFGDALNDIYSEIEWVFGSDFNDDISGDSANNRLEGRDGDDTLNGAGGNDRLLGGDGNDTVNGGDGVDTIFGQAGDDFMTGGAGNDFFFGGAGADSHDGEAGIDTVSYLASSIGLTIDMTGISSTGDAEGDSFFSIERIFGSAFDDIIIADADSMILLGNGGNDYLQGDMGNDSLNGGAGIDSFGYDTTFGGADVIQGFSTNELIYITNANFNSDFDTWAEVQAVGTDVGGNVIFDFGFGATLTIVGRNLAELDASNFDFSGTPPAAAPLSDPDAFAADIIDAFDMDALI